MKQRAAAIFLLLTVASWACAQSSAQTQMPTERNRSPTKTIRIGKANFYYYQSPDAVVATTSFYVSGSERTAGVFDFVALTVFFYNPGKNLVEPSVVRFNVVASTYRDGCKYKDKYADKNLNQLRLSVFADQQSIFSTGLSLPPTAIVNTRNGKMCTELYGFQISYQQFVRVTDARKAAMSLGIREFKISEDHLNTLRTMKDGIGRY
jgi:hypothetical protein